VVETVIRVAVVEGHTVTIGRIEDGARVRFTVRTVEAGHEGDETAGSSACVDTLTEAEAEYAAAVRELGPARQVWNRGNGPKCHRIAEAVDDYHVIGACGYAMDFWWLPEGFEPEAAERCRNCERAGA
jgi:hypothetical protein